MEKITFLEKVLGVLLTANLAFVVWMFQDYWKLRKTIVTDKDLKSEIEKISTTSSATVCIELDHMNNSLEHCEASLDSANSTLVKLTTKVSSIKSYLAEKVQEINNIHVKLGALEVEQGKLTERCKYLEKG